MILEFIDQIPKEAWPAVASALGFIGIIITALITIIGILVNNYCQSSRDRKSRNKTLTTQIYLDAIEFVSESVGMITSVIQQKMSEFDSQRISYKNSYKLYLVSSPKVAYSFAHLSRQISQIYLEIASDKIPIEILENEIQSNAVLMDSYKDRMEELIERHDQMIREGRFSQELSDTILSEHREKMSLFSDAAEDNKFKYDEIANMKLSLFKKFMPSYVNIQPHIVDFILTMRKDVELNLNKKDLELVVSALKDLKSFNEDFVSAFITKIENISENP